MLLVSLTCLVLILGSTAAANLKASDFFNICQRNDPNLDNCIKDVLNELRPKLKEGIPQLKILSLEPMVVPKVKVIQGSGPVSIDSTFHNLHVDGITNYDIVKVRAKPDKYRIDVEVAVPFLYMHGDYEISGQMLILPIVGHGDSWSNYTSVNGSASMIGHPEKRGGKEFMVLDEFKFDINVKRAIIHMNNLFNGNKALGDTMNRFMSENWEEVFRELKPVADEAIGTLLKDVASKVFNAFPYDELFPK